jgi:hypothetical protein
MWLGEDSDVAGRGLGCGWERTRMWLGEDSDVSGGGLLRTKSGARFSRRPNEDIRLRQFSREQSCLTEKVIW